MTTTRRRGPSASLDRIARFWQSLHTEAVDSELEKIFPGLKAIWIGWGEPFCFRCGWLAPAEDPYASRSWNSAAGWLERAHLLDAARGGSGLPENLVPLCVICHWQMPSFATRESAIAWVNGYSGGLVAYWQVVTDGAFSEDKYVNWAGAKHAAVKQLWSLFLERQAAAMNQAARIEC